MNTCTFYVNVRTSHTSRIDIQLDVKAERMDTDKLKADGKYLYCLIIVVGLLVSKLSRELRCGGAKLVLLFICRIFGTTLCVSSSWTFLKTKYTIMVFPLHTEVPKIILKQASQKRCSDNIQNYKI